MHFTGADLAPASPSSDCNKDSNLLFVQYTCIQNSNEQSWKYQTLVISVTTASLISLFFVLTLQKLYKGGKIEELEWDLSTVTAGDYTVEFEIPKHNYMEWYNNMYKRSGGEYSTGYAPALSLKRFMCQQIQSAL